MQGQFIYLSHTPLALLAAAASGNFSALIIVFGERAGPGVGDAAPHRARLRRGGRSISPRTRAGAASTPADAPFRPGLLALEIRKNLRLIARTPMILVQCIAQVLTHRSASRLSSATMTSAARSGSLSFSAPAF